MDRKRLDRLWKGIADARLSLQDASDLETLAALAERIAHPGGNHMMWHSHFQTHRAFPISRHGGNQKVGHRAQKVILDHLEADAAAWEDELDAQGQEENDA